MDTIINFLQTYQPFRHLIVALLIIFAGQPKNRLPPKPPMRIFRAAHDPPPSRIAGKGQHTTARFTTIVQSEGIVRHLNNPQSAVCSPVECHGVHHKGLRRHQLDKKAWPWPHGP